MTTFVSQLLVDPLLVMAPPFEKEPNKPYAANPAMTPWLTIEDQCRRVADLER
jgi:hypothetical protein